MKERLSASKHSKLNPNEWRNDAEEKKTVPSQSCLLHYHIIITERIGRRWCFSNSRIMNAAAVAASGLSLWNKCKYFPQSTLHNSKSTIHTSQFTIQNPHFTIQNPQFTLHNLKSKIHTPQFTIHNPQSTLHNSKSTLAFVGIWAGEFQLGFWSVVGIIAFCIS